tara:strand:+ start:71 stop:361 length:291 start_codon:yes stop_codon:yes gene_type:complete
MNQKIITLRLLDKDHQIKCDESQVETLKSAAILLSEKVKQEQNKYQLSLTNATLLAALNLCGEQIKLKKYTFNTFSQEQKDTLNELNQQITSAIEP